MIRLGAVLLLIVGVEAAFAGCAVGSPVPTSPAGPTTTPVRADRLIVLAGSVGAMRLMTAGSGHVEPLGGSGLPLGAAWISSAGTTLAATSLEGGVVIGSSGPGAGSGSPPMVAWSPARGDLAAAHPLRAFGVLDPSGARIAILDGDPGSGASGRLLVETIDGVVTRRFDLPRAAETAPAWLPDGRIVVVVRDQLDRPRAFVADPASGMLAATGGRSIRSIGIGGESLAAIDDLGGVDAWPIDRWSLDQPGRPIQVGGLPVGGGILQAQPSTAGDELALIVADRAGDAVGIRVVAVADGHEIARFGLPDGANRAVVGWLVAP